MRPFVVYYAEKFQRVLIVFKYFFSNFRIERSRTIVPALIDAVENCPKTKEVNIEYFYQLLFTRKNLKLVHIVCHDKQVHDSKKCDVNSIYSKKLKNSVKNSYDVTDSNQMIQPNLFYK